MAKRRPPISTAVRTDLLTQCKRRCCLCFGLKADIEQKEGQIAHLDRNRSNNRLDNLVWLCLPHHDDYDSVRRQTKRLTAEEVKFYRSKLNEQLSKYPFSGSPVDSEPIDFEEKSDVALSVIVRYSSADKTTSKVIAAEILTRVEQIYQFYRMQEAEFKSLNRINTSDNLDSHYWDIHFRVREQFALPSGIYGLWPDEQPTARWLRSARHLAKKWIAGELSYEQCKDVIWIFDEEFDLDPFFMLFGIPTDNVSLMQKRALRAFIFEHGQREFIYSEFKNMKDVPF